MRKELQRIHPQGDVDWQPEWWLDPATVELSCWALDTGFWSPSHSLEDWHLLQDENKNQGSISSSNPGFPEVLYNPGDLQSLCSLPPVAVRCSLNILKTKLMLPPSNKQSEKKETEGLQSLHVVHFLPPHTQIKSNCLNDCLHQVPWLLSNQGGEGEEGSWMWEENDGEIHTGLCRKLLLLQEKGPGFPGQRNTPASLKHFDTHFPKLPP